MTSREPKEAAETRCIRLHSPLSPAECAVRLAPLVDESCSFFNAWVCLTGVRPMIGRATERTLLLRRRGTWSLFPGVLSGNLQPAAEAGTLISGKMIWLAQIWIFVGFMVIWTLTLFMMLLQGIASQLAKAGDSHPRDWVGVAILATVLVAVVQGFVHSRRRMRADAAFFRELFVHKCDATPPGSPPPAKS